MLEEAGHILLGGLHQNAMPGFKVLGKGPQVAQVGLAGERTQPFLHPQI